jgi:hypothetical protein
MRMFAEGSGQAVAGTTGALGAGIAHPNLPRGDEALVRMGRRHPHIDADDVGPMQVDQRHQLVRRRRQRDHVDPPALQQRRDPLARDEAVVCDHRAHPVP